MSDAVFRSQPPAAQCVVAAVSDPGRPDQFILVGVTLAITQLSTTAVSPRPRRFGRFMMVNLGGDTFTIMVRVPLDSVTSEGMTSPDGYWQSVSSRIGQLCPEAAGLLVREISAAADAFQARSGPYSKVVDFESLQAYYATVRSLANAWFALHLFHGMAPGHADFSQHAEAIGAVSRLSLVWDASPGDWPHKSVVQGLARLADAAAA